MGQDAAIEGPITEFTYHQISVYYGIPKVAARLFCTRDTGLVFLNELWFGATFFANGTEPVGQVKEIIKIQLQFHAF
jgi:hypothetical protein